MIWRFQNGLEWSGPISNLEEKGRAAERVAAFLRDGDVVGVGSGSTAFLAIQAIRRRMDADRLSCLAIPTSFEMAAACAALRIPVTSLQSSRPDWSFDGTDEVDGQGNLIKGRGGALFQEKLLIASSPRTYIVADRTKLVEKLGHTFPIPIEVHPLAIRLVIERVVDGGAIEATIRTAVRKDGPVFTENGNMLIDARFATVDGDLDRALKAIPGVIETGLFWGYDPVVLFP